MDQVDGHLLANLKVNVTEIADGLREKQELYQQMNKITMKLKLASENTPVSRSIIVVFSFGYEANVSACFYFV